MPEPSLGEILSVRADPELGTGTPAVVIDSRDMVRNLNQAAQFNAEMKQRRYSEALGGLKELYQDVGKIQSMETMEEDKPLLNKKMADLFQEIGNDPQAIFSPRGGAKFADINKKLGELQSLATQSKQDNLLYQFNNRYIQSDPDYDTPENKAKIDAHKKGELGKRQGYTLETPPSFDANKAADNIMKGKNVAVPYADTEFSPDNKFIDKKEGIEYRKEPFLKDWNIGYNASPKIKKWADDLFDKSKNNPAELNQFVDPDSGEAPKSGQELYNNLGKIQFGAKEDFRSEKKSNRTANPYELLKGRQLNALALEGIKENNREKLAAVKAKLGLTDLAGNSDFLLRQYAAVAGSKTGSQRDIKLGGKTMREDELDVQGNMPILKAYAQSQKESLKEGTSLDPLSETIIRGNSPDVVTRTKDGNIRVIFYEHDKNGVVLGADGNPKFERQGIIPRRNLLTTLGKGVVPSKMLTTAIDAADQALQGKDNEFIDKVNKGEEGQPKKEGGSHPLPKGKPATIKQGGYTYTWNEKTGRYE